MSPRYRFILRYGVLGYGGGLFVLFNALHILRLHALGASLFGLPLWLIVTAPVAAVMGYGFGALVWWRGRRG
ncbi:MAG: hypothetical protein ACRYF4_05060 [Janthinobacterium lividum]